MHKYIYIMYSYSILAWYQHNNASRTYQELWKKKVPGKRRYVLCMLSLYTFRYFPTLLIWTFTNYESKDESWDLRHWLSFWATYLDELSQHKYLSPEARSGKRRISTDKKQWSRLLHTSKLIHSLTAVLFRQALFNMSSQDKKDRHWAT